jgi:hypothetical protein
MNVVAAPEPIAVFALIKAAGNILANRIMVYTETHWDTGVTQSYEGQLHQSSFPILTKLSNPNLLINLIQA